MSIRCAISALLVGFAALCASPSASSQVPAQPEPHHAPAGYDLVWADEFDEDGLPDPSRWRYDTARNAQGWYNQERQYYAANRAKNARIVAGNLIIEAHQERLDKSAFPDWGGQKYTSARLITQGLASWTYGFVEVRAKLACGVGTWPAIWMLPNDPAVIWPEGGEIDIMEHVGFDPGIVHQSIHTKAFNFTNNTQKTTQFPVKDACTSMHRYQMLWTPEFVLTGLDDAPKFMFRKTVKDVARWPFDKPLFLVLNIAIGGNWGGQKGINNSDLPAQMEIDYVRIYQPKPKT